MFLIGKISTKKNLKKKNNSLRQHEKPLIINHILILEDI